MPYVVARGNALLVPSGSIGNPSAMHLHVVATEICGDGKHLLLSVSSIKQGRHHDQSCIIQPGEHEFIVVPSFVDYRLARVIDAQHIVTCVDGWTYKSKPAVSDDLLRRMCDGLLISQFTPRFAQDYFEANKPQ